MFASIVSVIVEINNNYGRGDVIGVAFDDETRKTGTVTIRIPVTQQTGRIETRKFSFDCAKNTVRYCFHTRKIGYRKMK